MLCACAPQAQASSASAAIQASRRQLFKNIRAPFFQKSKMPAAGAHGLFLLVVKRKQGFILLRVWPKENLSVI
jgi:hypothetical protein